MDENLNTQQAAFMAAIDSALAPIDKVAASGGPVHASQLATVKTAVRQALAVMIYGPPAIPETADDEPQADAGSEDITDPEGGGTPNDEDKPPGGRFG